MEAFWASGGRVTFIPGIIASENTRADDGVWDSPNGTYVYDSLTGKWSSSNYETDKTDFDLALQPIGSWPVGYRPNRLTVKITYTGPLTSASFGITLYQDGGGITTVDGVSSGFDSGVQETRTYSFLYTSEDIYSLCIREVIGGFGADASPSFTIDEITLFNV